MNSPTKHYSSFCSSLAHVKRIVAGVNAIECKTDLQHLKLQSYILLSHSIIEEYLENLCESAALHAKLLFKEDDKITKTLVSLISTSVIDKISDKARKKVSSDLSTNLELFAIEAINTYRSTLINNNGITTRDQSNIFLPIGVDVTEFDIGLSQNLHNFGAKRGDVAHRFKPRREETLSNVETTLLNIKRDLLGLDKEVCKVCSPA